MSQNNFLFKDLDDSLETFNGESGKNIVDWLNDFSEILSVCGWNEVQCYLYARRLLIDFYKPGKPEKSCVEMIIMLEDESQREKKKILHQIKYQNGLTTILKCQVIQIFPAWLYSRRKKMPTIDFVLAIESLNQKPLKIGSRYQSLKTFQRICTMRMFLPAKTLETGFFMQIYTLKVANIRLSLRQMVSMNFVRYHLTFAILPQCVRGL